MLISQGVLEGRAGSGTYVAEEASFLGIQKAALVTHIRRTHYNDQGQPVETADIVVPAALCGIVYEVPIG